MAFDQKPTSWLSNYTYSNGSISFDLDGDYTEGMNQPAKFIYRVVDELLKKYLAKPQGDRPAMWTASQSIAPLRPTSPISLKIIENKLVLDSLLINDLNNPPFRTDVSIYNRRYNGGPYLYGRELQVNTDGIVEKIEFSSDGEVWAQTYPAYTGSPSLPSLPGNYLIRVTACKDSPFINPDTNLPVNPPYCSSRQHVEEVFFTIQKPQPLIIQPPPYTAYFNEVGQTITFNNPGYGINSTPFAKFRVFENTPMLGNPQNGFTSIFSDNNAVASVQSFNSDGSFVLSVIGIGTANITAVIEATDQHEGNSSQFAVVILRNKTTISAQNVTIQAAGAAQTISLPISANFPSWPSGAINQTRYELMDIRSLTPSVATLTKNASHPPTVSDVSPGVATIAIDWPGDVGYEPESAEATITVLGAPARMRPTISFSSQSSLCSTSGTALGTDWATDSSAGIQIGIDEIKAAALPISFTISLASPNSPHLPALGTLNYSFAQASTLPAGWISWSLDTTNKTITGTISSYPSSTAGDNLGGTLTLTMPAQGTRLAWSGTFNILVASPRPRVLLMASGLSGVANSTFTEVIQNINTSLSGFAEWAQSENCCPHEIKFKATGIEGASTSSQIRVELVSQVPAGVADLSASSPFIVVNQNSEFSVFVSKSGTFTVRLTCDTLVSDVVFAVGKLTPTITVTSSSAAECCPISPDGRIAGCNSFLGPYPDSTPEPTDTVPLTAGQVASINIQTTPSWLATAQNISTTISGPFLVAGEYELGQSVEVSLSATNAIGNVIYGSADFSLSETQKYESARAIRTLYKQKPYLYVGIKNNLGQWVKVAREVYSYRVFITDVNGDPHEQILSYPIYKTGFAVSACAPEPGQMPDDLEEIDVSRLPQAGNPWLEGIPVVIQGLPAGSILVENRHAFSKNVLMASPVTAGTGTKLFPTVPASSFHYAFEVSIDLQNSAVWPGSIESGAIDVGVDNLLRPTSNNLCVVCEGDGNTAGGSDYGGRDAAYRRRALYQSDKRFNSLNDYGLTTIIGGAPWSGSNYAKLISTLTDNIDYGSVPGSGLTLSTVGKSSGHIYFMIPPAGSMEDFSPQSESNYVYKNNGVLLPSNYVHIGTTLDKVYPPCGFYRGNNVDPKWGAWGKYPISPFAAWLCPGFNLAIPSYNDYIDQSVANVASFEVWADTALPYRTEDRTLGTFFNVGLPPAYLPVLAPDIGTANSEPNPTIWPSIPAINNVIFSHTMEVIHSKGLRPASHPFNNAFSFEPWAFIAKYGELPGGGLGELHDWPSWYGGTGTSPLGYPRSTRGVFGGGDWLHSPRYPNLNFTSTTPDYVPNGNAYIDNNYFKIVSGRTLIGASLTNWVGKVAYLTRHLIRIPFVSGTSL